MVGRISTLGLNGNPDTLLARAADMWQRACDPWGDGTGTWVPFPEVPATATTFEGVVEHLDSIGFTCVDVAGKADNPEQRWNWMFAVQGLSAPKAGEPWTVTFQSALRPEAFVTVKLDGSQVEAWSKDMMRSGLWQLVTVLPFR